MVAVRSNVVAKVTELSRLCNMLSKNEGWFPPKKEIPDCVFRTFLLQLPQQEKLVF